MTTQIDRQSLAERVNSRKWFHSINFGDGLIAAGHKTPEILNLESDVAFVHSVAGKSVLDIGAWDGHFSFEAKRRGAARVLSTDHFCWNGPGWGDKQGFELARKTLALDVEDLEIDPMDLDVSKVGHFDVVLFLGVLYHLRHPFLVLERIAPICDQMLVLETHVEVDNSGFPMMRFFPGDELGADHTNWWGPNRQAVEDMLRDVGFNRIEYRESLKGPNHVRAFFHAFK